MVEELKKLLQLFIHSNKSKYADLLYQLIKNDLETIDKELNDVFFDGLDPDVLKKHNPTVLNILTQFIRMRYGYDQISVFNEFVMNNEKNRIKENDLSKYKSFEAINKANYVATLNLDSKEMEQQMLKIYEDEDYLLIRPLTYFSSLKYGKTTKWCTTSEKSPEYFWQYASNGILIYLINKTKDYKYGIFKSLIHTEVSFWDEQDIRIDSYQMKTDSHIKEILFKVIETEKRANRSYLSEDVSRKEREIVTIRQRLGYIPDYTPVGGYIGNNNITFVETVGDDEVFKILKERNKERIRRTDSLSATFDNPPINRGEYFD